MTQDIKTEFFQCLEEFLKLNYQNDQNEHVNLLRRFWDTMNGAQGARSEILQYFLNDFKNELTPIFTLQQDITSANLNNLAINLSRIAIYVFIVSNESMKILYFINYLEDNLPATNRLTEHLLTTKKVTDFKYKQLYDNSLLFSQHTEELDKSLNKLATATAEELANKLETVTTEITSTKDTLAKQLEDEKNTAEKIIAKYNNISNAALDKLSSSFANFSEKKKIEMDKWLKATKKFGWLAVLIAIAAIILHPATGLISTLEAAKGAEETFNALFSSNTLYFIAIEALIIYFFRISLNNFYAARDELLQLEIREALCKFAPTYTAFADADDTRLDNFTKHIFSPLASKLNPTPHPLDFLGQVCNVVNNGKKK
ncbi:hypothetical protein [Halodesulfovibrio marinisediminis]|uniref:Uncharacterized protein n=1 Tax=Halodesulfovibrio marinisediminis DSM 17456 TaxID=1121457 RepID=A0A1N6DP93_9BACT|nr:hypothetical protein [Halodesulfovibrio marinisediminis]SIN72605.1 hypothetical protein SAMN02745161_0364 [Halodesulfovibrio marinisediminis DSM 17456]